VELPGHPFFVGVQYHPELKSTVENPQPIFVNFVRAAKEYAEKIAVVQRPAVQGEIA
jgi:CTP synthase